MNSTTREPSLLRYVTGVALLMALMIAVLTFMFGAISDVRADHARCASTPTALPTDGSAIQTCDGPGLTNR